MLALPLTGSTPELYHGKYVAGGFASGEQGVWYEPSLSNGTLFQDAAGTIPVTAVEQPVGLMKDKSGRGNHARQTTSADRPVFSARYNLLTKTEDFADAVWPKSIVSVTANSEVAPNGTLTADTFIPNSGIAFASVAGAFVNSASFFIQSLSVAATAYKYRLSVKDAGYDMVQLRVSEVNALTGTNQALTRVSLINGAVLTQGGTGNLTGVTATCTRTGDGWCDITLTFTSSVSQTLYFGLWAWNTTAVTSDGIKGLHIWGASLVPANQAPLPYQRVNTATDYDADPVKFPPYLRFNGVNSWMVTPSINFTGTDKMTVFAGVRKFSALGTFSHLCRLGDNTQSTNGFYIAAPSGIGQYTFMSAGSTQNSVYSQNTQYAAPNTAILSATADIAAPSILLRIDGGKEVLSNNNSHGQGNYSNNPIYIGKASASPFNGHLYSLIIRGAATDDAHLTHTEKFIAYKTGVNL